jgi:ABC-type bacteriocin/lantibiotic exporter with double-glycine peptidase domain
MDIFSLMLLVMMIHVIEPLFWSNFVVDGIKYKRSSEWLLSLCFVLVLLYTLSSAEIMVRLVFICKKDRILDRTN